VFIEAKDDGGGGDNWTTGAIGRAKLQSNYHHQQTNTQFLQSGCPSCHPTNSVKALKGKISHSIDLLTPSSPGGLLTLSMTTWHNDSFNFNLMLENVIQLVFIRHFIFATL